MMKRILTFALTALLATFAIGCLVSGTFVIVEDFTFTTHTGFYFYDVDITDEDDWEDHKDDIDNIDLVGFELFFTNNSGATATFDVWIDEASSPEYTNVDSVSTNATKVLGGLELAPGSSHLTYGNSFQYVTNVATLKQLVKTGMFHFYGTSNVTTGSFSVDSAKVIVTISASGS